MSFHSEQIVNHVIHNYTFATEAARLAATGFVAADIGKVARQSDDNSFWVLSGTAPIWTDMTASISADNTLLGASVKLNSAASPGDLFGVDGFDGGDLVPTVDLADFNMPDIRPAIGAVLNAASLGDVVKLLVAGEVSGLNTVAFDVGDRLYLQTSGAFSDVQQTLWSQDIGFVTRKDASNGRVFFDLSSRTEIKVTDLELDAGARDVISSL